MGEYSKDRACASSILSTNRRSLSRIIFRKRDKIVTCSNKDGAYTVRLAFIVRLSLFIGLSLACTTRAIFSNGFSTSKTFSIGLGRIGRQCQTNQGISVVDKDNELKFSKLFLAVWSKVWLECGWGRSVRGGEHVYSTRFPREASENRFRTLKPAPRRAVLNKSTQTDFKAPLKCFSGAWTSGRCIIYEENFIKYFARNVIPFVRFIRERSTRSTLLVE